MISFDLVFHSVTASAIAVVEMAVAPANPDTSA